MDTARADASAPLPAGYKPRDAEASPLHRAIRHHRAAFTIAARRRGQVFTRLVERELDGLLGCGVLARDCARVRCGAYGHAREGLAFAHAVDGGRGDGRSSSGRGR